MHNRPTHEQRATSRRRVLVAEDDFELRRLIVSALTTDGFDVSEVRDGGQLLRTIASNAANGSPQPSLVITDVRMPGMTGLEALEALRSLLAQTAVVVISAFPDANTRREAMRLGAIGVLDKPFSLDDLRMIALNSEHWPFSRRS
ncbi:MAG: response regulator [Polyangiales bacterium]